MFAGPVQRQKVLEPNAWAIGSGIHQQEHLSGQATHNRHDHFALLVLQHQTSEKLRVFKVGVEVIKALSLIESHQLVLVAFLVSPNPHRKGTIKNTCR